MNPATSIFLNLLRVLAAAAVFVHHEFSFWYDKVLHISNPLAHHAVVVFFVLSGYVIAYSTRARNQTPRQYAVARLSRLYSVLVPALVLTGVLYLAGNSINPEFYAEYSRGSELPRYFLTAFHLQSIWTFSASPPSNIAFWSLSYEFWYYALFGLAIFIKSARYRWMAIGTTLLIITPNILALLPCWLIGVVAYRYQGRWMTSPRTARIAFWLSLVATLLAVTLLPQLPYRLGHPGLWFSALFITDWIVALAVGLLLYSFDAARFVWAPGRGASMIRCGADHTFSLYLYHYPLLVFVNAVLPLGRDWIRHLLCSIAILVFIGGLSVITEARRDRWRALFDRLFGIVGSWALLRHAGAGGLGRGK